MGLTSTTNAELALGSSQNRHLFSPSSGDSGLVLEPVFAIRDQRYLLRSKLHQESTRATSGAGARHPCSCSCERCARVSLPGPPQEANREVFDPGGRGVRAVGLQRSVRRATHSPGVAVSSIATFKGPLHA